MSETISGITLDFDIDGEAQVIEGIKVAEHKTSLLRKLMRKFDRVRLLMGALSDESHADGELVEEERILRSEMIELADVIPTNGMEDTYLDSGGIELMREYYKDYAAA